MSSKRSQKYLNRLQGNGTNAKGARRTSFKAKKELNDVIHKSRREQIQERAKIQEEDKVKEKMYIQHIQKVDIEERKRQSLEARLWEEKNRQIRREQGKQCMENLTRREKETSDELRLERQVAKRLADENEEFCSFATGELERFRALGKKANLIERALNSATRYSKGSAQVNAKKAVN